MHDLIKHIAHYASMVAEGIAVTIIIAGILSSLVIYIKKTFLIKVDYLAVTESRNRLAHSLSLALEFLICADILKTAISPTWQDIGQLAAIVGIRTFLNFFLTKELKEGESHA
ncbi:MAG: DUF1622 domain-containing protein [Deltaproteobacteria bacterium]|nr:DUF1622 domain-containing protein [Deltaproteobacteria bacterium]